MSTTTPPSNPPVATDEEKIKVIIEEIRPYLQRDGGDCEFVSYERKLVHLRLHGACGTCPSSLMTLRMGADRLLPPRPGFARRFLSLHEFPAPALYGPRVMAEITDKPPTR